MSVSILMPENNGQHFADDIFLKKKKFLILIKIPLNFVPKSLLDKKSTLVKVMVGCKTGNKPLSAAILTEM